MSQKDKKDKKKNSGLGLALWCVAAIILLIFAIINWNKIATNLKETGFFNKVFGTTPEFIENHEVVEKPVEKNDVDPVAPVEIDIFNNESESPSVSSEPVTTGNDKAKEMEEAVSQSDKNQTSESEKKETGTEAKKEETAKTEQKPPVEAPKTMNIKLYFMEISSNGSVVRREVTRKMKKSDSPLVDSINALIKGPDASEESSGCRTMVSNGTRLIGASVKNGVATLNFSGDFEINQYGIEGLRGQLQQIVYTATAFPTVDSVQFLIEGEKKEFLGQEGVWIGTPLNRSSFF